MPVTSVNSGTSSVDLLTPDSSRSSVILSNDDANRLYVLLGEGTVSSSNYSFSLAQYENARLVGEEARGRIGGIWAADGSGAVRVTTKF